MSFTNKKIFVIVFILLLSVVYAVFLYYPWITFTVTDPESRQTVSVNELTILGEGVDVPALIKEFNGRVVFFG